VQRALDEAARLAERIHAPLLEMGSVAAAFHAAAVSAGVPASVEVTAGSSYPSEVVRTVARQILIEQRLYAEVEDAVDVEPVGELVLKGFSRPVAAFDVVAVRETAAGLSAVRGS
jgi:hypothetical protein